MVYFAACIIVGSFIGHFLLAVVGATLDHLTATKPVTVRTTRPTMTVVKKTSTDETPPYDHGA